MAHHITITSYVCICANCQNNAHPNVIKQVKARSKQQIMTACAIHCVKQCAMLYEQNDVIGRSNSTSCLPCCNYDSAANSPNYNKRQYIVFVIACTWHVYNRYY